MWANDPTQRPHSLALQSIQKVVEVQVFGQDQLYHHKIRDHFTGRHSDTLAFASMAWPGSGLDSGKVSFMSRTPTICQYLDSKYSC